MPPTYVVHAFCPLCSVPHDSMIEIRSKEDLGGAADRLGDQTNGARVPFNKLSIETVSARCPTTGKMVAARDNEDVFLVRVANEP